MHPFLGAWGAPFITAQRTNTTPSTITTTTSATQYNNITPVEIVASTTYDVGMIHLRSGSSISTTATRTDTVVELMAGAASSEQTIVGPIPWGGRQTGTRLLLPIFIPAGTRLSIRVRSRRQSVALLWTLDTYPAGNRDNVGYPQKWVAYGLVDDASTAARGTIVVPGSSNAWGSWTQVVASTTHAHDLWLPMVDAGVMGNGTTTAINTRSQFAIASTTDAATMATNGTVWDQGGLRTSTTEQVWCDLQSSTAAAPTGLGLAGQGLLYQPTASAATVAVRAMCSGTPDANSFSASILAAL